MRHRQLKYAFLTAFLQLRMSCLVCDVYEKSMRSMRSL